MDEGKTSEWNEATLKVVRLHEIQATINLLKLDPLNITEGKFNYELLANSVNLLYGEGRSKYKKTEKTEMDNIKNIVFNSLKLFPPHKIFVKDKLSHSSKYYKLNNNNYENLMILIELFENKTKDYNDEHGLTTKNRGNTDYF